MNEKNMIGNLLKVLMALDFDAKLLLFSYTAMTSNVQVVEDIKKDITFSHSSPGHIVDFGLPFFDLYLTK